MARRRRELGQLGAVVGFATNEPKKLFEELPKIAPLPPEKPKVEIDEYGERVVNGFVQDWWQEAQKTA